MGGVRARKLVGANAARIYGIEERYRQRSLGDRARA